MADSNGATEKLSTRTVFARHCQILPLSQNSGSLAFELSRAVTLRNDNELFTTVATENIRFSLKNTSQDIRLASDRSIALLVTIAVIELLEVIQIDH